MLYGKELMNEKEMVEEVTVKEMVSLQIQACRIVNTFMLLLRVAVIMNRFV